MRLYLTILIGKIIFYFTRILKIGGGSAAPGYYALKIDPNLVKKLTKQIPINIIVTGTNGKTTTSRLIDHFAKTRGLKVLRNHTGSNLERGITSSLITHYSLLITHYFDLAIWEIDEAAFNNLVPKINPKIVVFLNVFRDQLDRYGEIDTIVKRWQETVKKFPKNTILILNGDDENITSLAKSFSGKTQTFGVKNYTISGEALKKEIHGTRNFEAFRIKINGLSGTSFKLIIHHSSFIIHLPLPGIYHVYDFLAAFATGYSLNFDTEAMINSLKNYAPAFGRFEKLEFTNRDWKASSKPGLDFQTGFIFLIKNPVGATQVFQTIAPEIKKEDRLLIALNDNLADGKDVSWIWDANFEFIQNSPRAQSRGFKIFCSGTRAQDLAVRLKYAEFNPQNLIVENNLEKALKEIQKGLKGRLFILPTYTALLELQKILTKTGVKKHYWKEN